ncbi:DUF4259 domain-containing protein [Catenuloplanes japonicus]|uniref:DUF4259 domain-containing protein n=1 Tax=Catenuloplanes japonicus TaxID=33876 RepID=UPI0005269EBC|nr:DUF4259 domain-containing protein [Catenuloplanes japonicus]
MGAWGSGPFENDIALDWRDALQRSVTGDRAGLIRNALVSPDLLTYGAAAEAIAAATVVAAILPGGQALFDASGLPEEEAHRIPTTADTPALALRALDTVVTDESEWRRLWSESPSLYAEAVATLQQVRGILTDE